MLKSPGTTKASSNRVSFGEALRVWIKISLLSFGGPAGQIALMHRVLVEEKKWISESRFLHALNYCMLLPGPEAQQFATYIGWLLHRTAGGLVAGILFVLPGAIVILGLSILYAGYQEISFVQAIFFGIKAAVLAVVIEAVLRIGKRALKNSFMVSLAAAAFVGIFFFAVPFPLIVVLAALIGFIGGRLNPEKFIVIKDHEPDVNDETPVVDAALADGQSDHTRPSRARALRVTVVCLVLWLGPLGVLAALLGFENVYVQEGIFFSKMAVVTFGGAYAVLAYVAQEAVNNYGWLAPGEMLDGLGMAETTPVPISQSRSVLSRLPDKTRWPSPLNARDNTLSPCPSNTRKHSPVSTSHTRKFLSRPAETIREPSGDIATAFTRSVWPVSTCTHRWVNGSQSRTVRSAPQETT